MGELINWVQAHYDEVALFLTGCVTLASMIVRWTPTLKDDNVWLPFVKWLGKWIALNKFGPRPEDRPQ